MTLAGLTAEDLMTPLFNEETMKLNKYVAHSGVCSRRKAAELVKQGKITVNGEVMRQPFYEVAESDKVLYQGKMLVPQKDFIYLLMNKSKNLITTLQDEKGRKTVMDIIKPEHKKNRIFPVGRLDRNTTGLLLLTNDGQLADKLTHPRNEVKKIYHAVLNKPMTDQDLEKIKNGLQLEDGPIRVDKIARLEGQPETEIGVEIHSGRNRIVRRIFEHLGYEVLRLDRVYFAGLTKKDIPRGRYRVLTEKEIRLLKHFS